MKVVILRRKIYSTFKPMRNIWINENHDTDLDGVPNYRDCNPWNPHEQDLLYTDKRKCDKCGKWKPKNEVNYYRSRYPYLEGMFCNTCLKIVKKDEKEIKEIKRQSNFIGESVTETYKRQRGGFDFLNE